MDDSSDGSAEKPKKKEEPKQEINLLDLGEETKAPAKAAASGFDFMAQSAPQ